MSSSRERILVIKLGGSILFDDNSYREAARFLVRRLRTSSQERIVVVVSARKGTTDELEELARRITAYPNPRTLDLLWSTGEIHSVAVLTLHLEECGVSAVGLNIHETGLRLVASHGTEATLRVIATEIEQGLKEHWIVVVPGFFGTNDKGVIRSLGRGGSDLSAVLLADGFDSSDCELIKGVSGYFTADPTVHGRAEHIPRLSYDQALGMADEGCELVQDRAIEAARVAGVRLIVRGLDEATPGSVVSEEEGAVGQSF